MNKEVLIDAISLLPELYDKNHKHYGHIDHRNRVWETLAEKFGLPVDNIRNKWRNIRDAYQKTLKKKAQCMNNNTMEQYKAYKYEDQLKFLKDFCSATVKGVKRKSAHRDERFELKLQKLGYFYKPETEDFQQAADYNEYELRPITKSNLQEETNEPDETVEPVEPEEPEELFECLQFEEQKEYEQSVEDLNDLEAESSYEEFNEDMEINTVQSKAVVECPKHKLTNAISETKEADEVSKNVMSNFFLTVCSTVSTLPILLQAKIKKQVFDIVSEAEISYLTELSNQN